MARRITMVWLLVLGCCLAVPAAADAWISVVPGGVFEDPAVNADGATSVLVDPAGDVVTGGWLTDQADGTFMFLTKRDGATGEERWRVGFDGTLGPPGFQSCGNPVRTRLSFDAFGDVLAAGMLCTSVPSPAVASGVVKISSASGAPLWIATPSGSSGFGVLDVASTTTGDVVAGGQLSGGDFTVLELAGASGTPIWQRDLDGIDSSDPGSDTNDGSNAVALDANDDVLAAGTIEQATGRALAVAKFDGATGADAWAAPVLVEIPAVGTHVRGDGNGDVVAAGWVGTSALEILVVKLNGSDGSELWRTSVTVPAATFAFPEALLVDPAGDVLVAGLVGDALDPRRGIVAKLSGASGTELWRFTDGDTTEGYSLALEASSGTVLAAGTTTDALSIGDVDIVVHRLDPTTGTLVRSYRVDGNQMASVYASDDDFGNAVALGPDGRIAVAGGVGERPYRVTVPGTDFAVVQFSDRLAGSSLLVRDAGTTSTLRMRTRDPGVLASAQGGPGDPTLTGATLELRNPLTSEVVSFSLPAAGWRSSAGRRPGQQKYRYRDSTASAGPCRSVALKSGRILKLLCQGSLGGFTLDEPAQGTLSLRLSVGATGAAYCLAFDGSTDQPGLFQSADSLPPAACD